MDPTIKKKRTDNFNEGEEKILISLVKKYQHIVESKRTDAITNSEKLKTWEIICNEYNTICSGCKTAQALRTKFNNLKKKTKQKFATEKRLLGRTGGGPPPPEIKVNNVEFELRSMMGHTLTGFKSKFDDAQTENPVIEDAENETSHYGDSEEQILIQYVDEDLPADNEIDYSDDKLKGYSENFLKHSSSVAQQKSAPSPTPLYLHNCSETNAPKKLMAASTSFIEKENQKSIINDWSSYTPAKLKQQKSSELKVPKRGSTSTIKEKISTWALSKSDLVKLQKQAFEDEHKLKLQHMIEKHKLFLELQREEWQLKRTHMIKVHKQKLLNLNHNSDD